MSQEPTRVYRWSPYPVDRYCYPGSANHWLAEVGPEAWNLAWLALPNPEFEPAPSGFKTALRQSLSRRAEVTVAGGVVRRISLRQMVRGEALGCAVLAGYARWPDEPRVMTMAPDWRTQWRERAQFARGHHPDRLNRMFDDPARHLEAARILLTGYGWATRFEGSSP